MTPARTRASSPPSAARRRLADRYLPRVLAVGAGAVGILLFPAPGLGWLSWVAFVPLLLVLRAAPSGREGLIRGWCGGFGFTSATMYWLVPNLIYFFPLAMAAAALLWAPWGWSVRELLRTPVTARRGAAALAIVPAGWVLIEALRSWKPFGGPWSLLGVTQWDHPTELGLASVGGVWLLSYAIMLSNTALVLALTTAGPRRLAALLTAAAAVGAGPLWFAAHPAPDPVRVLRVSLVQPGVIHDEQARYTAQLRETLALPGAPRPDLIVWGESSADYIAGDPARIARLAQISAHYGAAVMVNGRSVPPSGGQRNTSYVIGPHGVTGEYSKTRLVMFGEYIPLRGQLGWLDKITQAAATSLASGTGPVVLDAGGLRVAPLICFESAFPDLARTDTVRGAQLIVYQSADSTFQGSWAPAQHASLAAVRAAETGRPAIHSALTGASAAYDAQGRRLVWLSAQSTGAVSASVPVSAIDTPYDRFGDYVPVFCALLAGGALAAHTGRAAVRRAKDRRAITPGQTPKSDGEPPSAKAGPKGGLAQ